MPRSIATLALAGAGLLAGCLFEQGGPPVPERDLALEVDCAVAAPIAIGRCQGCMGAAPRDSEFVALPEGARLTINRGIQGGSMIDVSLQTSGIFIGTPYDELAVPTNDRPLVQVTARDDRGAVVQSWQLTGWFHPERGAPELLSTHLTGLVLRDGFPVGMPMTLDAYVVDHDGEGRCGSHRVVVGP